MFSTVLGSLEVDISVVRVVLSLKHSMTCSAYRGPSASDSFKHDTLEWSK